MMVSLRTMVGGSQASLNKVSMFDVVVLVVVFVLVVVYWFVWDYMETQDTKKV